ncbi:MAG: MOSC domain-containing protein [Gaiellales bacterium]
MSGPTIAWISTAPVKGLATQQHESLELRASGLAGDRRFHLVDETGRLVNGKRLGLLVCVTARYDDGSTLALAFPGGETVAGEVELGGAVETGFYGTFRDGREVLGPWSAALSEHAGVSLRLIHGTREGAGLDRDVAAAVSLLSLASLGRLAEVLGVPELDQRRFRMGIGIAGVRPHEEDEWFGRRVRIGDAVIEPHAHIGRCAVTKLDPETGVPTLDTLGAIKHYRSEIASEEALPFGVQARVLEPGRVAVGDPLVVESS